MMKPLKLGANMIHYELSEVERNVTYRCVCCCRFPEWHQWGRSGPESKLWGLFCPVMHYGVTYTSDIKALIPKWNRLMSLSFDNATEEEIHESLNN